VGAPCELTAGVEFENLHPIEKQAITKNIAIRVFSRKLGTAVAGVLVTGISPFGLESVIAVTLPSNVRIAASG
jgi:hypothetical protein